MCSIICNTGLFGSVRETFNINPVFFYQSRRGAHLKLGSGPQHTGSLIS